MEVLANRLKWLREKNRLAQKEVASNIGVTLSGYQQFEYGKSNPKLETLVKIAQYFEITTDFLLGVTDSIGDLDKLKEEIVEIGMRKEMIRRELEVVNYQIHEVFSEKRTPIQTIEFSIELGMKEKMLSNRKVSMEQELYAIQDRYRNIIFGYVETLLNIPKSDINSNPVIKMLTPFSIEIQPNIFDEFSLALFCKEGFIGNYGAYKTEEAALEVRHVLLSMLNSK